MTTLETLLNDPDMAGVWNLVPDRSTISFKIRNMWGLLNVKGRFTDFSGDGQLTGNGAVFGRLDIRAGSLDTGIGRRDEHLRSADFFDVDRFGEISVVVTGVQPTQGKAAELRANFTIKGVTAPVPLPVTVTANSSSARICRSNHASASGRVLSAQLSPVRTRRTPRSRIHLTASSRR